MKKTILERLGLEPVNKLNRKICLERVKHLRARIENEDLSKPMTKYAKYYANWYSWMAKNGGSRPVKKATAAARKKAFKKTTKKAAAPKEAPQGAEAKTA